MLELRAGFVKATNPPKIDPITDAFSVGAYYANQQVPGVLDHRGHTHFFERCYLTKPCKTLVDFYDDSPRATPYDNPGDLEDGRCANAVAEKAKADHIAAQIETHNATHPEDKVGLMQVWIDERPSKEEIELISTGEIVGLRLWDTRSAVP